MEGRLITIALGDACCAVSRGENKWTPTRFNHAGYRRDHLAIDIHVKDGKIKSMEEIYLHSLPIKEYQIVDFFLPKLKDEVMKVCINFFYGFAYLRAQAG